MKLLYYRIISLPKFPFDFALWDPSNIGTLAAGKLKTTHNLSQTELTWISCNKSDFHIMKRNRRLLYLITRKARMDRVIRKKMNNHYNIQLAMEGKINK